MSGERGYHCGGSHVAAKHALVGLIKGIRGELADKGIDIVDIRPGAIDTGLYDSPSVQKSIELIAKKDAMWSGQKPCFASPMAVAEAVYEALFDPSPKEVYRILAPHQH